MTGKINLEDALKWLVGFIGKVLIIEAHIILRSLEFSVTWPVDQVSLVVAVSVCMSPPQTRSCSGLNAWIVFTFYSESAQSRASKMRRCSRLDAWIVPVFCSGLSPHGALKQVRVPDWIVDCPRCSGFMNWTQIFCFVF